MSTPRWGGLHSHALLAVEGEPLIDGVTTDRAAAGERLDQVLAAQPGVLGVLVHQAGPGAEWVDEHGDPARLVMERWIADLAASNVVVVADPVDHAWRMEHPQPML